MVAMALKMSSLDVEFSPGRLPELVWLQCLFLCCGECPRVCVQCLFFARRREKEVPGHGFKLMLRRAFQGRRVPLLRLI